MLEKALVFFHISYIFMRKLTNQGGALTLEKRCNRVKL